MFLSVQKTASQCLILKAADLHENPTDWCDTPDHVLVFERVCVYVYLCVCVRVATTAMCDGFSGS